MKNLIRWFWIVGVIFMIVHPFVAPLPDEITTSIYDWAMVALAAVIGGATGISLMEYLLWKASGSQK